MTSLPIVIKKISSAPIRYGLYLEGALKFSFNHLIYNQFFKSNQNNDFSYDLNALEEIAKEARDSLKNEMFQFLSKQETSPRKLLEWLNKRMISSAEVEENVKLALENNFFSPSRFIDFFIEKKSYQANRPWWQARQELYYQLDRYRDDEEIREIVESKKYDDLELLKNNRSLQEEARRQPEKVQKFLKNRGFQHQVINDFFQYLGEEI